MTLCNAFSVTFPRCGRLNIHLEGPGWRRRDSPVGRERTQTLRGGKHLSMFVLALKRYEINQLRTESVNEMSSMNTELSEASKAP